MDDFSLNDAALADKVLGGVPPEQTDDELARRGFPSAFDDLLQQYRMIQQKVQQGGAPAPQTTVADDIKGLIALNNQLSPQVGQVIQQLGAQQGQGQPMPAQGPPGMPPQGQPEPQPQPQPQPPPMQQGLGGIDAGMMQNPQLARGGIIAFANKGAVESTTDEPQEAQEPMTYNTYMAGNPDEASAAPVATTTEETKLPSSYSDYMSQMQSNLSGYKKDVAAREERLKNRPLYQAAPDPSIEEDRRRIVAEKLANEHDIDKDRWQSLVDMGLAWAESAARGDDPLVSLVAGSKAGTTSLRKINDDYKKTQAALDKELIALDHAKYVAEETQRKSAYDQVTAIETKIDALHSDLFKTEAEIQKNAVTAALNKEQVSKAHVTEGSGFVDALTQKNIQSGMDPVTARAEAVREYIRQTKQFGATTGASVDLIEAYIKQKTEMEESLNRQRMMLNPEEIQAKQAEIASLDRLIQQERNKLNEGSVTPTAPSGATPQVNIVPGSIRQGP